jgi:hypothetical protein
VADMKRLSTVFPMFFLIGAMALTINQGCTDGAVVSPDDASAGDDTHAATGDALGEVGEEDTNPRTCPDDMESCVFCKGDADCVGVFPQQTLCENALCDPDFRVCVLESANEGDSCSDGNICNGVEACLSIEDTLECVADLPLACLDDNACNGVETCDPVEGCLPGAPPQCDDQDDCTQDVCEPAMGCLHLPARIAGCCDVDPQCDDGNPCTDDWCDGPTGTCYNDVAGGSCDDGNACNGQYVCDEGNCIMLPDSVVTCPPYADNCVQWTCNPADGLCQSQDSQAGTSCDAGPCITNSKCTAQGACEGQPVSCADGDDCTVDTCDPVAGCQYTAVPGCDSKFLLCEIHGSLGDVVECPFMLVQESALVAPPVGVDFQLSWNVDQVQANGFLDEFCFGDVCVPKELPTCAADGTGCIWGSLSPTGHNIVAVPKDLAQWLGVGTLLFFHPTDPFAHFTETLLGDDGTVMADEATFIIARFKLLQNIPVESPSKLWMANAHFGLPSGEKLQYKVVSTPQGRAIVVF